MDQSRFRKFIPALGWLLAAVILIAYLISKYDIKLQERTSSEREATEITKPTEAPKPPKAKEQQLKAKEAEPRIRSSQPSVSQTEPRQAKPRELSTQELFQLANPAVVLIEVFNDEGQKVAHGSGFLASGDGSLVTNYHVIQGGYRATVRLADRSSGSVAGVVGYDSDRDVAVLKIGGLALPQALHLGNSDTIQVGHRLVAIGSPLGLQNTLSEGIVSALRSGLIQMSVPISPGSSGGPVLNTRGEVVGVAVATVVGGQNLNFAVPINWVKTYIGGGPPRSLADVAQENTVIEPIWDESVSVRPGQVLTHTFEVHSDMSNAVLEGWFQSRKGPLGGNVRVYLMYGDQVIYDGQGAEQDEIRMSLFEEGTYTLVLDNQQSTLTPHSARIKFTLRYVR